MTVQKWEYFVAPLLEHNPGEILNSFGEDGWERLEAAILRRLEKADGMTLSGSLPLGAPRDGHARLVVRRETWDDLLARDVAP